MSGMMRNRASAADRGPFAPEINTALSACFGDISGLSLVGGANGKCAEIGAEAFASGNTIGLGPNINPSLDDPFSMEVIGHEVAHALAGGGSGEHEVDQAGDPGEAGADAAGSAFRRFVTGGMASAPSLQPARGGRARFQRWCSGEHMQAVDNAATDGSNVSDGAAEQLNQRITLANGLEVTPGEVTAMMGDYYGIVDPQTHELDPAASLEQLSNADPEEMQRLLSGIRHEAEGGEEMATEDLEWLTRRREDHQSYLEMAQINDSHFSGRDNEGLDNNMGVYNALHGLALENAQAAAGGDADAANTARLYEAMSMHYLTDRHASGHSFNKQEAMNANGSTQDADGTDGTVRNLYAKLAHDDFNNHGADMTNANGDSWRAYGDGMWASDENAQNRTQTHDSVATSYDELARVMSGDASAEDLADQGYGANGTVPEFSEANQERANSIVRNSNLWSIASNYYDAAPGAILGAGARLLGQGQNAVVGAWDTVTDGAVGAWNTTTDAIGQGWNTATDAAVGAWNSTTDGAVDLWNRGTSAVGRGWNTATDSAVGAWNDTTDAVSSGWTSATDTVGSGWTSATDTVSSGWTSATDTVSSGWSSATDTVGSYIPSISFSVPW